jgi:hypothetical protein
MTPPIRPLCVSFGGGVDGTAMLILMQQRNIVPSRIVFADTGNRDAEKPETYLHVDAMSKATKIWWGVEIEIVRNDGQYRTLENNCLQAKMLPSIAYGFKSCSDKYKIRPINKSLKAWMLAQNLSEVDVAIGYNASESHRSHQITENDLGHGLKAYTRYLLIEWGVTAEYARQICQDHLGYIPMKSACFYCPSSKKSEILWLKKHHPDLFQRAIAMERNAAENLHTIKGLGRNWSWEELTKNNESQFELFPEVVPMPCICSDGES